ncbi:DUF4941 domain-containing protein [Pseudothermotoga sp.]|uniref:DUF4941 domain-containing protein n=1 Tax=Pseudothermotoga sp. TaxID=2033661 RepID=UPI0031F65CF2
MRKILIFLTLVLVFILAFAVEIYVGDQLIFTSSGDSLLKWDKFVELIRSYFERMNFEVPTVGSVGSFNYLIWNGHTVGFDSSAEFVNLDGVTKRSSGVNLIEVLKTFGLPFVLRENRLILPNMWIYEIQKIQDIIDITYGGERKIEVKQVEESIFLESRGYVFYNNTLYEPGQIVTKFNREPNESIKQEIELKGLLRLVLGKSLAPSKVRIVALNENVLFVQNELTILYTHGDGRIIIRPYAPEYDGTDWPVYAELRRIAEKLREKFSFKLEICPLIVLPPQTTTMLLLIEDEAIITQVKDFLEELLK